MCRDLRVHIWVTRTGGLERSSSLFGYPIAEIEQRKGKGGRKERRKRGEEERKGKKI